MLATLRSSVSLHPTYDMWRYSLVIQSCVNVPGSNCLSVLSLSVGDFIPDQPSTYDSLGQQSEILGE